ncbi:MAG TPA: TolC family protein [Gemmatimonadaceae bacterium]|jgi:outer membrane protein
MRSKLIALLAAPAVLGAQQRMTQPPPGDTSTFHQVSLAEALRLAHDNNVQNITADNAIRTANNTVRGNKARYLPTLSASAGQNISQGSRLGQSNDYIPIASKWAYSTGLSAGYTVWDGGKTRADIRNAQATVASMQAQEVNTEFSVSFQVKQAYNSVLAAKESESAARAQLATAQLTLQTSIAKVNAGAANVADSLQSVVQVGNAQLAILNAQNTFRTQSAALTTLVGTPYFVTANLVDTVEHLGTPIDSAQVMALATQGPTVRSADAAINAANAAERSAKAAYQPTVQLSGGFSGNGTNAFYGVPGLRGDNGYPYAKSFGINATLPIFNQFQRENQIANSQINLDNAQAQARAARLSAQQNVVTGVANLRNAEESMNVQANSVTAATEALRVVTQRYNLGASTQLEVTTAQQNLVTAQQQLITARLNYRNARAQIEAAIGRDIP